MIWPSHILPSPSVELSEDYSSNLAVTQFELSLRQRERYSIQDNLKSVSWMFNQFQFDFFKSFVNHSLNSGSRKFTVDLPGLDGMTPTEVSLLGGSFSSQHQGVLHWKVTASLVVENPELASDELTNILLELTGGSIESIMCSMESVYEYMENFYGDPDSIPPCSITI